MYNAISTKVIQVDQLLQPIIWLALCFPWYMLPFFFFKLLPPPLPPPALRDPDLVQGVFPWPSLVASPRHWAPQRLQAERLVQIPYSLANQPVGFDRLFVCFPCGWTLRKLKLREKKEKLNDNNEKQKERVTLALTTPIKYTTSEENTVWDLISFGCGHSDGASVNGMHFCSALA